MPNNDDGLSASPDGVAHSSFNVHEAAEFTSRLKRDFVAAREPLGTPWGDKNVTGDDFAKDYDKVFVPMEQNFALYLDALVQATQDTADNLLKTARSLSGTEDVNEETAAVVDPDAQDGRQGRR
ncbi:hypothetical protein [Nocardiopsis sp. NRRL B-16309]|uniref:hypothetical protein n=1 Tax=Nocardiopsis sp. NRRL B-16309 TaxID=1519494 RepID=UPI0006AFF262|nr:hypothetical protein [Nocardiopsis sp. NRRL B-16309]KOX13767.1 hypothetical protein ADL05_18450 [Nocardiopsis sp. NRRL B-16309]